VGLGGALATGSHFTKAGTRVVVNTSPEPFSNWAVSIAEDLLVVAGLWLAIRHPWLFVALLCLFIALAVWLAPKLWRGIKRVMETLARLFAGRPLTRRFRLTGRPR
jgi:protein-S-isoprenylcysteine O-methyltransferase Ste14